MVERRWGRAGIPRIVADMNLAPPGLPRGRSCDDAGMGRSRVSGPLALLAAVALVGCARPRSPAPASLPRPVRPAPPPLPPPPAAPPTITLVPEGGSAGTPVTVSGRGFPPDAPVSVHVGPPQSEASEEAYGRGQANDRGEVTVTFPMPPLALPPDGGSPRTVVVLATTPGFRDKATAAFAYAPAAAPPAPAAPSAAPSPPVHPMGRAATPQEERAIRAAVLRHLESIRLMGGVTVEVQAIIGRHVRTRARPPQGRGDPGYVFLERGRRGWTVLLGPGASFEDGELKAKGIPPGLWPAGRED
jgi:hypothetical protein